ncbi:hypothetical protein RFI_28975 [Reticulomyxa filosa]|uniref:Kelch motif family protein n=1 Tax=Reticulomyxa filosa TaxID=46433 RepID=X6M487_RETFI|nr:hypothetical protein RFI_28975 [Reticulomyxa filosa]|eukprot:ETO08411.1 hypothetical protein RFI_28975 [Reticulomyxa filosa]
MNPTGIKSVNVDTTVVFENVVPLPIRLFQSQCVTYNNEILICGGYHNNECYSYHRLKNEYKRICSYPINIKLVGHCVVKRVNQNNLNNVTLLSFGGFYGHTLAMKYVSVWKDEEERIEIKKTKKSNRWLPLIDKHNKPIRIGRKEDDYWGMRAVIGGSNNHLLFISYSPNNIDVYNLDTLQYINHTILPTESNEICYHCFVSKPKTKIKRDEMLLFFAKTGLSIKYNEDDNIFQFEKLQTGMTIRSLLYYAYVYIDDTILCFGGDGDSVMGTSNTVHKYFVNGNKWMTFKCTLPIPLWGSIGILSEDHTYVHILGGQDETGNNTFTHIKTNLKHWMNTESAIEKYLLIEEEEKREIEQIKMELEGTKQGFHFRKLKVGFFFKKKQNSFFTCL